MSNAELSKRLGKAFTADGQWNTDVLAACQAEFWRAWVEARLRGRDPWVPYARDEYPDTANRLFVRFGRYAQETGIGLEECHRGAASLVKRLQRASAGSHSCCQASRSSRKALLNFTTPIPFA